MIASAKTRPSPTLRGGLNEHDGTETIRLLRSRNQASTESSCSSGERPTSAPRLTPSQAQTQRVDECGTAEVERVL